MKTTKRTTKPVKANLIVAQGEGWRVEFDRLTKDYLAMVNGVGCIGYTTSPVEAQRLCQEHVARQHAPAAA